MIPQKNRNISNEVIFNPQIPSIEAGYGFTGNGKPENNQYFYHSDHLGSTSYITDRQGNAEQFIVYMPYGEVLTEEHGSWESPYRFNGKELDAETGLYYYGARYYEPNVAMWYGVDPMAEKYPNVGGYVYCVGNPVRLIDPDGKEFGEPDRPFGRPNYDSKPTNTPPSANSTQPPQSTPKTNSEKISQTSTISYQTPRIPENSLITVSSHTAITEGRANTLNVNATQTLSPNESPISVSSEFQVKNAAVGGAVKTEIGIDGSSTQGGSVFVGPIQIGVSTTQSPDVINSSVNLNIDIHKGNQSAGISIGIKPMGIMVVAAAILAPEAIPVLIPALIK